MKIVIVETGLIGRAVAEALRSRHHVTSASRSHSQNPVDLESRNSIRRFYDRIGSFDALA